MSPGLRLYAISYAFVYYVMMMPFTLFRRHASDYAMAIVSSFIAMPAAAMLAPPPRHVFCLARTPLAVVD